MTYVPIKYKIKKEYWNLWECQSEEQSFITTTNIQELSLAWGIPEWELLREVEEIAINTNIITERRYENVLFYKNKYTGEIGTEEAVKREYGRDVADNYVDPVTMPYMTWKDGRYTLISKTQLEEFPVTVTTKSTYKTKIKAPSSTIAKQIVKELIENGDLYQESEEIEKIDIQYEF